MLLVDMGKASLPVDNALKAAWWWAVVVNTWHKVRGIREAAGYDPEKKTAPRDLWLDEKGLTDWYKEREKMRSNGVLDDYGR